MQLILETYNPTIKVLELRLVPEEKADNKEKRASEKLVSTVERLSQKNKNYPVLRHKYNGELLTISLADCNRTALDVFLSETKQYFLDAGVTETNWNSFIDELSKRTQSLAQVKPETSQLNKIDPEIFYDTVLEYLDPPSQHALIRSSKYTKESMGGKLSFKTLLRSEFPDDYKNLQLKIESSLVTSTISDPYKKAYFVARERDYENNEERTNRMKKLFRLFKTGDLDQIKKTDPNLTLHELWSVENNSKVLLNWAAMKKHQHLLDYCYNEIVLPCYQTGPQHSLDIMKKNEDKTVLHWAICCNQAKETVDALLKAGANSNQTTTDNLTPLHLAAQNGNRDVFELLLTKDANVSASTYSLQKPLHLAAEYGHLDIIKILIAKNADVDAREENDLTPLHCAVIDGHYEVVKFLLTKGAGINEEDDDGNTALYFAIQCGQLDIVKLLLANHAYVKTAGEDVRALLEVAAKHDQLHIVEFLRINNKLDINAPLGEEGLTLLHIASKHGYLDTMEFLLTKGANINARDKFGNTPLYVPAASGQLGSVKFLIAHGADINLSGYDTPIVGAARNQQLPIVRVLLAKGAKIVNMMTGPGNDTSTLLHDAAEQGYLDIVKVLLATGADVNARIIDTLRLDLTHSSLYHHLIRDEASTFQDAATRARIMDATPLQLAAENGHRDVVKCLASHPAFVLEHLKETLGIPDKEKSMIMSDIIKWMSKHLNAPSSLLTELAKSIDSTNSHHLLCLHMLIENSQNPSHLSKIIKTLLDASENVPTVKKSIGSLINPLQEMQGNLSRKMDLASVKEKREKIKTAFLTEMEEKNKAAAAAKATNKRKHEDVNQENLTDEDEAQAYKKSKTESSASVARNTRKRKNR